MAKTWNESKPPRKNKQKKTKKKQKKTQKTRRIEKNPKQTYPLVSCLMHEKYGLETPIDLQNQRKKKNYSNGIEGEMKMKKSKYMAICNVSCA